jgi:hypothetical protein
VSSKLTEKQRRKFLGSVTSDDVTGLTTKLKPIEDWKKPEWSHKPPPAWVTVCVSSTRRAPYGERSCPEDHAYKSLLGASGSQCIRNVVARHESFFESVLPIDMFFNIEPSRSGSLADNFGHLSPIQEPGYKMRGVANPNRVIQAALKPLQNAVMTILRDIPEDCTFDQAKGFSTIQTWMARGQTVHSVDLSDATNLFPWPLQRQLLHDYLPLLKEDIDIMDEVVNGPWLSKIGEPEIVHFSRGQPLGLGPSFGTFALSHNTLLRGICDKKGLPREYFILGDDIVIGNDELNRIYRASLDNLGCQVSASKTISSRHYCEFAGFSITPDHRAKGAKWRDVSDVSFLDHVKSMGKSALPFLTKDQRCVANLVAKLPRSLGGLGWSDGQTFDSWSDTIDGQVALLATFDDVEKYHRWEDLRSVLRKHLFLFQNSPSYSPGLGERIMDGESWRQLSLGDLISNIKGPDVPKLHFVVTTSEKACDEMKRDGYFRVTKGPNDPRPSVNPYVNRFIEISDAIRPLDPETRSRLVRFVSRARSRPVSKSSNKKLGNNPTLKGRSKPQDTPKDVLRRSQSAKL